MPLTSATLAGGLETLALTTEEPDVIDGLVAAWADYFAEATVSGATTVPGSFEAGLTAMRGALVGVSQPNAGAAVIAAGVSAFWTAILASPTTIWVTAPIVLVPPIVPPVGLAGLAAALQAVAPTNTAAELSLADAAAAVAGVIHTANVGGLVPGSVPPTVPAPIPIL